MELHNDIIAPPPQCVAQPNAMAKRSMIVTLIALTYSALFGYDLLNGVVHMSSLSMYGAFNNGYARLSPLAKLIMLPFGFSHSLAYLILALCGLVSSVGLYQRYHWARYVFSGVVTVLAFLKALFMIAVAVLLRSTPLTQNSVPPGMTVSVAIAITAVAGVVLLMCLAFNIFVVYLVNRRSVRWEYLVTT